MSDFEETLVLVKPDGVARQLTGEILRRIEAKGYELVEIGETLRGTLFHAWVEQRSGRAGQGGSLDDALWELDDDAAETEVSLGEEQALATLYQVMEELGIEGHPPPSTAEIGARVGWEPHVVQAVCAAVRLPLSLERPLGPAAPWRRW